MSRPRFRLGHRVAAYVAADLDAWSFRWAERPPPLFATLICLFVMPPLLPLFGVGWGLSPHAADHSGGYFSLGLTVVSLVTGLLAAWKRRRVRASAGPTHLRPPRR